MRSQLASRFASQHYDGAMVMVGPVLDGEQVEPVLLHQQQRFGQAGDVASGKDVLDGAVVGRPPAHVEGRRDEADASRAQARGDAADPLLVAGAPRVLVHADRDEAVVGGRLVRELAMVPFDDREVAGLESWWPNLAGDPAAAFDES
jgi:hypothetical protein